MPLRSYLILILTVIGAGGLTVALLASGPGFAGFGFLALAAVAVLRLWGRYGA